MGTQCQGYYDSTLQMQVYTFVDIMPEYPGGAEELLQYIMKNFRYPDQSLYQGRIVCSFVVNKDGSGIGFNINRKEDNDYTLSEKELLRVLKQMPKWKAGNCEGKTVPVRIILPINF